jgi:sulfur transfer protein SufE
MTMTAYPAKLNALLADFSDVTDRHERAEMLIEIADRFANVKVPAEIAPKPYDEANHVQFCESEAYVWAVDQPDGTLKYYFDVLNPQGLSAMAISVILDETASNTPLDQVAAIPNTIVMDLFGKEVSMGKGQGLMGIVSMVTHAAKKRLDSA